MIDINEHIKSCFFVFLLCVLIIVIRLHGINEPLERDLTTYGYIAHNLINGENLYSYLWDHKPPGIFAVYMLGERLWGYDQRSITYVGILFSIISLYFIYLYLKHAYGKEVAFIGSLLWVLASNSVTLQANQPNVELFMNTFSLIGIWAYSCSRGNRTGYLFLSGASWAIASTFKMIAVFPAVFISLHIFYLLKNSDLKYRIGRWIYLNFIFFIPFVIFWALIFGYFASDGRFPDFYKAVFKYNQYYSGNMFHNIVAFFASPNLLFHASLRDVWILAFLSACWFFRQKNDPERMFLILLTLGVSIQIASPGQYYPHYYQLILPILCITSAVVIWNFYNQVLSTANKSLKTVLYLCLLFPFLFLGYHQIRYLNSDPFLISSLKYGNQFIQSYYVGRYIKENTNADDEIFAWGADSGIYYYSKRNSVSGISYIYPLLKGPQDMRDLKTKQVFEDVTSRQPLFFIFNKKFGDVKRNLFYQFLEEKYDLIGEIEFYLIYKKR